MDGFWSRHVQGFELARALTRAEFCVGTCKILNAHVQLFPVRTCSPENYKI